MTIKNFNVGILLTATTTYDANGNPYHWWAESNKIKHVRIENCTTGIWYKSTDNAGSFAFTNIDDVGIQLANDSNSVGVKVGTDNTTLSNLYSPYIKANVWTGSAGGVGMKFRRGAITNGLVNLCVQGSSGYGIGVDSYTQSNFTQNNQFGHFYLSYRGLTDWINSQNPPTNEILHTAF